MATHIYYPASSSILQRTVLGSNLAQHIINVQPDTIFFFDNTGSLSSLTSSDVNVGHSVSSSYSATSSLLLGSVESASFSTIAISASYALNGGNGGATLNTGSLYPITSSVAENYYGSVNSASYAATANTALSINFTPQSSTSASYASSSTSASYSNTANTALSINFTPGSAISASYASSSTSAGSASYALASTTALSINFTPISSTSASYASSSTSASYALTYNGSVSSASYATNAQTAYSINFTPGSATSASYASSSTSAGSASYSAIATTALSINFTPLSATSASYASASTSASYALNGGGATISTGSLYPITSSWATNVLNFSGSVTSASYAGTASLLLGSIESASYSLVAQNVLGSITSASYATTANVALSINFTPLSTTSSSYASSSTSAGSASYALTSTTALSINFTPLSATSASYASSSTSASYALTYNGSVSSASYATSAQTAHSINFTPLSTTSASYASSSTSASYSNTATTALSINFTPLSATSASYASSSTSAGSSSYATTATIALSIGFTPLSATSASYASSSRSSTSASYASSSTSASYALTYNGSVASASYSTNAQTAYSINFTPLSATSASWANSSLSASWAPSVGGISLSTGSTYPITSSWAFSSLTSSLVEINTISSSYADFAPVLFTNIRVIDGNLLVRSSYTGNWFKFDVYDDGSGSYSTEITSSSATGSITNSGSMYILSASYATVANSAYTVVLKPTNATSASYASSSISSSYSLTSTTANSITFTPGSATSASYASSSTTSGTSITSSYVSGAMFVGPWPSNSTFAAVGTTGLQQSAAGNYALLQSVSTGQTILNSALGQQLNLRINNGNILTLTASSAEFAAAVAVTSSKGFYGTASVAEAYFGSVTSASYAGTATTANSINFKPLSATSASYASSSISSSFATTAQNVLGSITSASYSSTSSLLLGSVVSSSFATTALNVLGSITSASYASTATTASYSYGAYSVSIVDPLFGAKSDFTTDATDAIQQAIYSISASGGTVFCPRGLYKVNGTIHITRGVRLLGESPYGNNSYGTIFRRSTSTPTPMITSSFGSWGLEGIIFYGDGLHSGSTGVHMFSSSLCSIRNCSFYKWGIGLNVEYSWTGDISNCIFTWSTCSLLLHESTNRVNIYNNNFAANICAISASSDITVTDGINIWGNVIEANDHGIMMDGNNTSTPWLINNNIADNHFEDNSVDSIVISGSYKTNIFHNSFVGPANTTHITLSGSRYASIKENYLYGTNLCKLRLVGNSYLQRVGNYLSDQNITSSLNTFETINDDTTTLFSNLLQATASYAVSASYALSASYATAARPRLTVYSGSDAAVIQTDANLGDHFRVLLGGNRVLGNPTASVDGTKITWELIQDGVGTRTITLDSKFVTGSDFSVATNMTASRRDFLTAMYNSTTDKWYVLGIVKGY